MKTDNIASVRKLFTNYFCLFHTKLRHNMTLEEHLTKFNHNDYHIIKASGKQKVVTYDELLEFKYSGYIFFKKSLYNVENILEWCNLFSFQYLVKPVPPFSPSKIIIKE